MEVIKLQKAKLCLSKSGHPEVVPGEVDTTYILQSREDVLEFLSGKPDADMEITWVCVECHSLNKNTYHSHSSRCSYCGKTNFPSVPLPMTGTVERAVETMTKRAILSGKLKELKQHTADDMRTITRYEEEISDARIRIKMRAEEMKKYTTALELTK